MSSFSRKGKTGALAALGAVGLVAGTLIALPSASATIVGGATLSPASGGIDTLISAGSSGPCAAPAVKVRAIARGFGFPATANGQIIYAPTTVNFSTVSPMLLPLSNSFRVYAQNNGNTALVGAYDVRIQCVNSLGSVIFDEFQNTMTWTTPGNSFANIDAATFTSSPTVVVPPTTAPPTTTSPPTTTAPPTTAPPTTAPPVAPPVKVASPSLVGTVRVGSTLACRTGSWTGATALSIRWLRNGVAITGGTRSTYRLSSLDYLKFVSCRVTASNAGGAVAASTSALRVGAGIFVNTRAPYLTGTARVGRTLTAVRGSWSPVPRLYSYQWLRNGSAISRATRSTYVTSRTDRGKNISVRVTVKATGYSTTFRTSKALRVS